jgi:hypothetical protein
MSQSEDTNQELSFKEDDSLNRLSQEELAKFDNVVELFLKDPTNSKYVWLLTDNLIELSDAVPYIRKGYYENFPNLILNSRALLKTALLVSEDKTISALIKECIEKIDSCLKRLNIEPKEYPKPSYPGVYRYPYFSQYKAKRPSLVDNSIEKQLGRRYAKFLLHRYDPGYEDNETNEELRSLVDELPIRKGPLYDETISQCLMEGIQRLKDRNREYEERKAKFSELEDKKTELSKEKADLASFREDLLMKCIDAEIKKSREN